MKEHQEKQITHRSTGGKSSLASVGDTDISTHRFCGKLYVVIHHMDNYKVSQPI